MTESELSVRTAVLILLDDESGLRCLAPTVKDFWRTLLESAPEEGLAEFWQFRLRWACEYVEPLTELCYEFEDSTLCLGDVFQRLAHDDGDDDEDLSEADPEESEDLDVAHGDPCDEDGSHSDASAIAQRLGGGLSFLQDVNAAMVSELSEDVSDTPASFLREICRAANRSGVDDVLRPLIRRRFGIVDPDDFEIGESDEAEIGDFDETVRESADLQQWQDESLADLPRDEQVWLLIWSDDPHHYDELWQSAAEAWLGLPEEGSEWPGVLTTERLESRFESVDWGSQATLIYQLARTARRIESDGECKAAALILAWLGLPWSLEFEESGPPAHVFSGSFAELPSQLQVDLMGELAKSLELTHPDAPAARTALLERWAFGEAGAWPDRQWLRERLADLLDEVPQQSQILLMTSWADTVKVLSNRGMSAAILLLESWLGIAPEDYADPERVARHIESRLADVDMDDHATLVCALSAVLPNFRPRQDRATFRLLFAWLRFQPELAADASACREWLANRLKGLEPDTMATLMSVLSTAVVSLGKSQVMVRLLAAWLNLDPEHLGCGPKLQAALNEVSAEARDQLLLSIVNLLQFARPARFHDSAELLDYVTGMTPDDYGHPAEYGAGVRQRLQPQTAVNVANRLSSLEQALRYTSPQRHTQLIPLLQNVLQLDGGAIPENDPIVGELPLGVQVILISTLTAALIFEHPPRDAEVVTLAESWLRISPELFQDRDALRQHLMARLESVDTGNQVKLLSHYTRSLPAVRPDGDPMARMILEAWINLTPEAYQKSPAELCELLRDCLEGGEPNNEGMVLGPLVKSLRESDPRAAAVLCDASELLIWGCPAEVFGVDLSDGSIHEVNTWAWIEMRLGVLDPGADRVPRILEAVVTGIRRFREMVGTAPQMDAIQASLVSLSKEIRRIMMRRWEREPLLQAAEELRFLEWQEQLENRTLVFRMGQVIADTSETAIAPLSHVPNTWPLAAPWTRENVESHVRRRPSLALSAASPVRTMALGWDETSALVAPPAENTLVWSTAPSAERQAPTDLRGLVDEPGTVWLRGWFEPDGAWCWSAYQRDFETLKRLMGGRSAAGAEQRLRCLARWAQRAIEQVWIEFDLLHHPEAQRAAFPIPGYDAPLLHVARLLLHGEPPPGPEHGLWKALQRTLSKLAECHGWEPVAALLRNVCDRWQNGGVSQRWVALATSEIQLLLHGDRRLADCPRVEDRERTRRELLEQITDTVLELLHEDWELDSLAGLLDAHSTDLLLQVEGPLLQLPVRWLAVGGRPLFVHCASVTSIVSLTQRWKSRESAQTAGTRVSRDVLTAIWEQPSVRLRAIGLPRMLDGLHRAAGPAQLTAWSLGDEPRLTRGNLIAALASRPYGAVVLGGHGSRHRAGLQLADGFWCGDGSKLAAHDFLMFIACSVGELEADGTLDVRGFYAEIAAHGGRCATVARYQIADSEAATFTCALFDAYEHELQRTDRQPTSFVRARAFNQACARLAETPHGETSRHLMAAFELYGWG